MRRLSVAAALVVAATGCGTAARKAAPARCVVRIYFCTEFSCKRAASKAQVRALSRRLAVDDDIFSVRFIDRRQALAIMRKQHPAMMQNLPLNPLPDSLRVRPVQGVASRAVAAKVHPRGDGVQAVKFVRGAPCGTST